MLAIVLRCLAAAAIAGGALALQQLVLEDDALLDQRGAKVFTVGFESEAVGGDRLTKVVVPADAPAKARPLLVFLHGRGEDERSYLNATLFRALERLGRRAPIVAFPEGGEASYWHDREDGEWAGYVLAEVIPRVVRRFGIDRQRIAIGGISMGGYGAYNVARLRPLDFCAVGGHSPALWTDPDDAAAGAFDGAEDYERNDVFAAAERDPSPFGRPRLWLDVGDDDAFAPAVEEFATALQSDPDVRLAYKTRPGEHDSDYWEDHFYGYLRFYGEALDECGAADEPSKPGPPNPAP